jgi:hypothetical protein
VQTETLVELILILGVFAAPVLWVWRYPVETALAIFAYLAVEELVLNYVPEALYAPARLGPEVLLLIGALSTVVRAGRERRLEELRPFWPEWGTLGVLLIGTAVAVVRRVPPVFTVIGLRWLFRYLPLYVIWRMNGDARRLSLLIRVAAAVVFSQAAIGIAQALLQSSGVPILDWMQAAVGRADLGGVDIVTGGSKQQLGKPFYVFGTLGRYHRYGIFLAAAGLLPTFAVLYRLQSDRLWKVGLVVAALALVLSTSRQAMLLVALSVLGMAWLRLGLPERVATLIRGVSVVGFWAAVAIVATGAWAALREGSALLSRLVDIRTLGFRAYYLLVIVPRVLRESHFLGFGAGTFASRPHVLAYPDQYLKWGFPGTWTLQFSYDSEWAILLGQYGVPGFVLLYAAVLGFGWLMWRNLKTTQPGSAERVVLACGACLALVLPFLGAVGAEMGSRTTAYVVWSVLGAGMSYVVRLRGSASAKEAAVRGRAE